MHATRLGSRVTIGVFGHYGNKNLGDEAIIEAVFQGIRRHLPNARIETFSAYPDDSAERYGVPSHPIRRTRGAAGPAPTASRNGSSPRPASSRPETDGGIRAAIKRVPLVGTGLRIGAAALRGLPGLPSELAFMARSYRSLKGIDLLMVTGSNQFLDNFGGPSGFPLTLLKWSVLAKLAGIPIVFVSVGAGPIFSPLSMAMIRGALLFSSYTSLRDAASLRLIEDGWLSGIGHVYPDLAHGLDMDRYQDRPDRPRSGTERARIGINPMAVYDRRYWYTHDDTIYRTYVAKLAELTHRLTERGNPVFLFPTQVKDENVIDDVLARMREAGYPVDPERLRRTPRAVYELMDIIDSGDVIVATRFHGTVLSLLAGKPTFGLCYYRKAADLLGEMGQRRFARLVEEFDVDEVLDRLEDLERDAGPIGATIRARGEAYREALDEQYRRIFRPLVDRVPEPRRGPAIRRARSVV